MRPWVRIQLPRQLGQHGWVRDLTRAGFRVLGVDQRGHGASDKPHDARDYTMDALVADLLTVLETYLLDSVLYAGYSLGGRVGWQLLVDAPDRVTRAVLGGIPDGRPLARAGHRPGACVRRERHARSKTRSPRIT